MLKPLIKKAKATSEPIATREKCILGILFILREGLIYYINGEERIYLYIPLSIK